MHPAPARHPTQPINILLVEDRASLRRVVRILIESNPQFKVVAEAGTPAEAVASLQGPLHLAIVDLALGQAETGLDLIRSLREQRPGLPILVLSMHSEEMHAQHTLDAGALGYLMKDQATEHLHAAMTAVAAGKLWLSKALRNDPKYQAG